jgi:hypothetical protein
MSGTIRERSTKYRSIKQKSTKYSHSREKSKSQYSHIREVSKTQIQPCAGVETTRNPAKCVAEKILQVLQSTYLFSLLFTAVNKPHQGRIYKGDTYTPGKNVGKTRKDNLIISLKHP